MKKSTTAWLDLALRDLHAAKKLLDDEFLANVVLFHAQQCIEKCFKAILEENDVPVPKIHGIVKLYDMVRKRTKTSLPITADQLDFIDDIYIDARYPGDWGLLPSGFPKKEDAVEIVSLAKNIYNVTLGKIKSA